MHHEHGLQGGPPNLSISGMKEGGMKGMVGL